MTLVRPVKKKWIRNVASRALANLSISLELNARAINHLFLHKVAYPFVAVRNEHWRFMGWEDDFSLNLPAKIYSKYKDMLPQNFLKMEKDGMIVTKTLDEVSHLMKKGRPRGKGYYYTLGEHNSWYRVSPFAAWYRKAINYRKLMDTAQLYDNKLWWVVYSFAFPWGSILREFPLQKRIIMWVSYLKNPGHSKTIQWNSMHYYKNNPDNYYYPNFEYFQRDPFWRNPFYVFKIKYVYGDFKYTFKEGVSVPSIYLVGLFL